MKEETTIEDENILETSPKKEFSIHSDEEQATSALSAAGTFEDLTNHSCYCLANIMAKTNVRFHTVNHFTSPRSLNSSLKAIGTNSSTDKNLLTSDTTNDTSVPPDSTDITSSNREEDNQEENIVEYIVKNGDALLMETEKIRNKNRIRKRDLEEKERIILTEFPPTTTAVIVHGTNSYDELPPELSSARSSSSEMFGHEQRKNGLSRKKKIWRKQFEKNRNNYKENHTYNRSPIETYPTIASPNALEIHNNYFNLAMQQTPNRDALTSPYPNHSLSPVPTGELLSNDHPQNGYYSDNYDNNSNNSIVLPSGRGKPRRSERKINVDKVGEMLDEAQTKLEALLDEVSLKD